jgi:hypothetical protein
MQVAKPSFISRSRSTSDQLTSDVYKRPSPEASSQNTPASSPTSTAGE